MRQITKFSVSIDGYLSSDEHSYALEVPRCRPTLRFWLAGPVPPIEPIEPLADGSG